jgi:hypothetical protein
LNDTPGVKYFLVAAPWLERHGSHEAGDPGAASETWDTINRVLTGKRMELLRYVRHNNVTSVRVLAKELSPQEARAVEVRGLPPFAKYAKDGAPGRRTTLRY